MAAQKNDGAAVRPLNANDFDAVVAIDAAITGRSRRQYVDRRLKAAIKDPKLHVQFGVDHGGRLAGFVMARRLSGEFGRSAPALRLELIGVMPDAQGHGIGDKLLGALESYARNHGIRELRTQAAWRNHTMLRFFDHTGFRLGLNQVIECEVHAGALGASGEDAETHPSPDQGGREIDYSATPSNDFEALDRDNADVRSFAPSDVPDVSRIDRHIIGTDREAFIRQLVTEALDEGGVRVSLTARKDGIVAGYVMAKTDFGDFGRTEPVAVIDTLGVDPDYAQHGIGAALMSQLFVNLHALGVERVETVVARENFPLLRFFYKAGFVASERLAFVKSL